MRFKLLLLCISFLLSRAFVYAAINVVSRGADKTGKVDAAAIIEACINEGRQTKTDVYIPAGTYLLARKISFNPEKSNADPLDPESFYDWQGIAIYGDGWKTIFIGATSKGSDTFNLYCVKNIHFRDFSVTNIISNNGASPSGSNAISIVNGENITFTNIKAFDATGVEKDGWFDGGKGFTVQSRYAKDIIFADCYAYNCPSGFLMQYDNKLSTNIVLYRCKAEKCQEGLFLGWATAGERGVNHTAVSADIDITNCMVGYREEIAEGVNASIRIKNTQRLNRLRKNAQGKLWLQLDSLSEFRQATYACFFYGSYYSDINVDIQAKQLNNVLLFDNYDVHSKFANGNNKIHVSVNPNVRLVRNPAHKRIGEGNLPEIKIFMAQPTHTHLPFNNSDIALQGFDERDIPQHTLIPGYDNRIRLGSHVILNELK